MKARYLLLLLLFGYGSANAATCKINEYRLIGSDAQNRAVPLAQEPYVATQTVTYTISTQSAALNAQTEFVLIICDAKAHFVFGTNPTATANSFYMPADTETGRKVSPGQSMKIAFYDGSS